jgi:YHS domain-containing protein
MEGASQAGQLGKDALTGEPLMDVENVVEAEIKGKSYRFVNEENAQKFREQKENEE